MITAKFEFIGIALQDRGYLSAGDGDGDALQLAWRADHTLMHQHSVCADLRADTGDAPITSAFPYDMTLNR